MSKTRKVIINVAKKLAPIVSSRDIAFSLRRAIIGVWANAVDLDFHDVEFISRSAAHELLRLKSNFSKRWFMRKDIEFVNTNDNVSSMMRIVEASQNVPKPVAEESHFQKVDIDNLSQLAF